MDCPKCGLTNPETASRCDCGYDFATGKMRPAAPSQTVAAAARFASGHSLAILLTVFLMAHLALGTVGAFSAYSQVRLVSRVAAGGSISRDEATANDNRESALAVLRTALYLLTGVPFLVWLHRAYANLAALGAPNLRFTPGWAVGWFFVPFANLVRPYQVLKETWSKSAPTLADGALPDEEPRIVAIWWALFLVFNFTYRAASSHIGRPGTSIGELVAGSWIFFVGSLFGIPAAVAAILLIRNIDHRQTARMRQLVGTAA